MKFPDDLEIEISPDGIITSLYIDGLADELGAKILNVQRASQVEWDRYGKGWRVYGHLQSYGYATVVSDGKGDFYVSNAHPTDCSAHVFKTREEAIEVEKRLYRQLIGKKRR